MEAGASHVPADVGTWGNSAGFAPEPSPVETEQPSGRSIAGEAAIGAAQGTGELAWDAANPMAFTALTFGGKATYQFWGAVWNGYREDALLGAVDGSGLGSLHDHDCE